MHVPDSMMEQAATLISGGAQRVELLKWEELLGWTDRSWLRFTKEDEMVVEMCM